MTHLEGACMLSLDLLASECSNMNGSEILKCCSVTNRTESWWNVHAKHVCVYVCTILYQRFSLRETKTVMATSTSKSGTAYFTLNRYHVKNIAHSFLCQNLEFFIPFLQLYYALVFIWLCCFQHKCLFPGQNFVTVVLNKEMSFHIFGSLPTTGEEVLQYFKENYNSTHGVIFLIFFCQYLFMEPC